MAYMTCMAPCVACERVFSFNPDLVPSVTIDGVREPVCQACVDRANPLRIAGGLEPIRVMPGAYDAQEVD